MRTFIWDVLKDNDDADDAEMETAMALFLARGRFFEQYADHSFQKWALTTGVRKALNALRDRSKYRQRFQQDHVDVDAYDSPFIDLGFDEVDERLGGQNVVLESVIAQAYMINPLGIDLAIRVCSGESHVDLAESERVPVGTVKSRIHRGVTTMRLVAARESL